MITILSLLVTGESVTGRIVWKITSLRSNASRNLAKRNYYRNEPRNGLRSKSGRSRKFTHAGAKPGEIHDLAMGAAVTENRGERLIRRMMEKVLAVAVGT